MSESAPSLGGGDRDAEYASAGILGHGPVMVPGNAPRPDVADQRVLSMPQVLADLSGALGIQRQYGATGTCPVGNARGSSQAYGWTDVRSINGTPARGLTHDKTTTKKANLVN